MSRARTAVAVMTLSMLAFTALKNHEGYSSTAVIPVKNDRPTIGHGSTFWEDGTPVKMGETITPERAVVLAKKHISMEEKALQKCLGNIPLYQHEYDAIMSWTYNVGTGAACRSTLVKRLKEGRYTEACNELSRWTRAGGRELRGLVIRREKERLECLGLPP